MPDAIQVADRWHLWHNLAEYAGKTVAGHRGCLKDQPGVDGAPCPAGTLEHEPPGQAEAGQVPPDGFLDACGRERRLVARTRERHAEIRRRLDAGESLSAISRATGLDRKTVQRFARAGSRDLEAWLAAVEADDQAGLRSLAAGIRNDQQAVTNGLTLHWNSGMVEGTVNIKIKMIKRQMYGRASSDLLLPQTRHLAPCVTGSQNSRQNPLNPHEPLFPGRRDRHPGPAFGHGGCFSGFLSPFSCCCLGVSSPGLRRSPRCCCLLCGGPGCPGRRSG